MLISQLIQNKRFTITTPESFALITSQVYQFILSAEYTLPDLAIAKILNIDLFLVRRSLLELQIDDLAYKDSRQFWGGIDCV